MEETIGDSNLDLLGQPSLFPESEPGTTGYDPYGTDLLLAAAAPSSAAASGGTAGPSWLEYSGHYRLRHESKQNFDFVYSRPNVDGVADNDDNYLLSRFRLHLDLRPNDFVHAHFTFQDSREFGSHQLNRDALDRTGSDIWEDKADVHEAWLKMRLGDSPLSIQGGRMQLNYGNQRLIGGFNWSNNARTFDAAKLIYERDNFKLDLVAANVVRIDSNAWNNSVDHDNLFFGYATLTDFPQGTQDFYLIYRDNDRAEKEIYTLGTRIDGSCGPLDWNLEGAYQWGSSIDTVAGVNPDDRFLDHKAFAAHAELGYTCANQPLKPRLAFGYDYASGDDDPNDSENNTFDNLFPTNHGHYGYMDFFSWRNLSSPYVKLSWIQSENLKIRTHWHFFWLDEEANDAWYNAGGGVVRNAAGADTSSFVGHELDIVASYAVRKDIKMEIGYSHFFAENYVADTTAGTGGADDADFFYLQTVWTF